jgi:hypothetical protein
LAAARDFTLVNHIVNKCLPGVSSVALQTRLPNPTPTNTSEGEHVGTSEHYILTAVESPQGENLTLNRLPTLVRVPARVDRWMGRLLEAIRRTLAVQTREVSKLRVLCLTKISRLRFVPLIFEKGRK